MKQLVGWGAILLGVLIILNVLNVMSVISMALGVAALVAATLSFVTRLQAGRFSINSVLVALLGVALMFNREATLLTLTQVLAVILGAIGLSNLWQYRRRRFPREQARFVGGVVVLSTAGLLLLFPGLPLALLRIGLGIGLIGYGAFRLAAKTVVFQQFTWNETIRRSMEEGTKQNPDIIDVEVDDDSDKKS